MSQAKLTVRELRQLKWLLGSALALLSFWALSGLDLQGKWILGVASLVSVTVFVFPGLTARIPAMAWRFAAPALALVVCIDFAMSVPDFIPSLVRMVVYLLAYRMLAPRGRREDLQLVLLCLFCLVIAGVLTVSLLFAVQLVLFTPVAMALLFVVTVLDHEGAATAPSGLWDGFSLRRLARRVRKVADLRVLSLCAGLFSLIVLISSLIFVLMPRIDLQQAIPLMEMKTQARSGFSEEVALGSVADIIEDDSVAFRVDVPSLEAIDSAPYWRMLVLDRYREGRFRISPLLQSGAFRKAFNTRELKGWGLSEGKRDSALWTFYMEGGISKYLPLPGSYDVLRFQGVQEVYRTPELYLVNLEAVKQSVFFYQIAGLRWEERFPASEREVEAYSGKPRPAGGGDAADALAPRYPATALELEIDVSDRAYLSALAQQIAGSAGSIGAERFARAAARYLQQSYRYSLSPDGEAGAGDPIVSWLRTGSRGHCEYFAGALVLLLREAGYPARLVVGFRGGGWNAVENYFVARNSDAHAWVEVYDAASRDWVRMDPTPGAGTSAAGARDGSGLDLEGGWTAWTDSLRIQWYRRIVNFDESSQEAVFAATKKAVTASFEALKARFKDLAVRTLEWVRMPWGFDRLADIALILGAAVLCGFLFLYRGFFGRHLRRLCRRPARKDPVRQRAGRLLVQVKAVRARPDAGASGERRRAALKRRLERLRFGPEEGREAAGPVFAASRRFLRRLR